MKRRALSTGFCVVVALIACGVSPFAPSEHAITPPASPARSLSPLATVTVQSKPTLCATVGGAFANGTPVKLVTCSGASTQQWAASSAGEYRANGTAYCLDTYNGSSADGTIAFIWDCYGAPSQQWTVSASAELKGVGGKCLEPQGQRLKTNTALVIMACANRASQKWVAPLAPVAPPPTCQDTTATNYGGALPCTYPPPPSDTYVTVLPGQSIQAAVDANPAGTKFKLKAGTYARQTVVPKAGDLFRGEPGAVLDGENVTAFAFSAGAAWVGNVTLVNVEVTRYAPPAQRGAINASGDDTLSAATGWVLDSVNVHHNANIGIRTGHRMQVLRTTSSANGTAGIGGVGRAILVDGSTFRLNNSGCINNPGFESGGSKFVMTDSLVVRNSTFSDNCGVGLWLDILNRNYDLHHNTIANNAREGLCVEVSFGGVIHDNTLTGNGWPTDPYRANGWLWDAGIGIHASIDVEVYGNTLVDNFQGLVILQQRRDASTGDWYAPPGGFIAQNVSLHDNTVTCRTFGGVNGGDGTVCAGAVSDVGDPAIFTTRNNHFERNTYYTGSNTWAFAWQNGFRGWTDWLTYGHDDTGSNNP